MAGPSALLPSSSAVCLCKAPTTPCLQAFGVCRKRRVSNSLLIKASELQDAIQPTQISRRSAAALLSAAPLLVLAPSARALIPDDDDEELIEKAKANRKSRLATERVAEKEYAKTGGFADGEVVAVQIAVNKLAKSGEALAAGDLPAVAATVGSDAWVGDFQKATSGLSTSEAAKRSATAVFEGIGALESSAKNGSLVDAKRSFVTAVSALQTWADDAGIAASLKGL
ncbi:probable thylakoid lumenal 16.5 kDa protein, chloroplastic [Coccomyxa sp. Obi]|nr:probable thylakoid lumenal 16.5 kDa protein, chloroplastic [Coccomyxa sp. Obi]